MYNNNSCGVSLLYIARVVNNTFWKYWQYQYQYLVKKVLPIPIPILFEQYFFYHIYTYTYVSPVYFLSQQKKSKPNNIYPKSQWRVTLLLGRLMDIRINLDYKLSGNIRIINYLSTWRLILFMYFFCVVFQNFYGILQKFCTLIRVLSKILAAGLERTSIGLYFRDFTLSVPPCPIMNLWFYLTSMPLQWNHLPETTPYWYPYI